MEAFFVNLLSFSKSFSVDADIENAFILLNGTRVHCDLFETLNNFSFLLDSKNRFPTLQAHWPGTILRGILSMLLLVEIHPKI